ncbi:MAG TPA: outer membrane beta-barrel protein [Usitatibacter sp.]|nr:outer membrane beta-barrel protein [Usitatibacter sp.]
MKKANVGLALLIAASGSIAAVNAQVRPAYQYPPAPSSSGPARVQLGSSPVYFTPFLGVAYGRDDNLFLTAANEKSSDLAVLSPGFTLDTRSERTVLSVRYQGQAGRYFQSRDDDYVDHATRAQFDVAFDRRNFLKLGLDYIRGHDPRGSTDRAIAGSPDRYELTVPSVAYAFGTPGAQGRAEVYYSRPDRKYLNNRATTTISDRRIQELGGAFFWRAMPKTYVLVEARGTDIDYRDPSVTLGARERRYYGGVSWEATAATTGTLKFGRLEREFDRDRPKFSGSSWEGAITWAPRSYSKFDLYTARQTNEATGVGNFILSSITGVTWSHSWTSSLITAVDLRYAKDEFQGADRQDETKSIGLKVGYKFRRWLTLGAEYSHTQRDSNQRAFEYDKNLYLLTATASM